jgi:NDP-sugar pyrophosphorylase family protein
MPVELPPSFWESSWTQREEVRGRVGGAILAAGLGSRMDPLTSYHLPKPVFPLGGKVPMAELWVRRFIESGISDISMNLCVLAGAIRRQFGDGARFGVGIRYAEEETPSGTLGGVCKQALGPDPARPWFAGSTLIVPSGDIVTNFGAELLGEMHELHRRAGAAFSMVLVPVPWERRKDFGTVVLDRPEEREGILSRFGRIAQFLEKDPDSPSNLNNASIYMIEMDLIRALDGLRTEADPALATPFYDFGKHVFPAMLGRIGYAKLPKDFTLWGVQYDGAWFDVGQKRDYLRVNEQVLDGTIEVDLPYERLPWGHLGTGVRADFSRITIVPPVVLGHGCSVASGATLGPYAVVGDGWTVGERAAIRHSVLWERHAFTTERGVEIPPEERLALDPHVVEAGAVVEESIVVGGTLAGAVRESTVDVLEDGSMRVLPIDQVPSGPRA